MLFPTTLARYGREAWEGPRERGGGGDWGWAGIKLGYGGTAGGSSGGSQGAKASASSCC